MTRLRDLLATAAARLGPASDSPRLDAEVLLAWTLGLTRTELLAETDALADANVEDFFYQLIARRRRGLPVAYITGRQAFMDFDLMVNPHTLIPRPFTETLVAALLDDLGGTDRVVADIGTGSGAIALAVARHAPTGRVIGTDVSLPALQVAAANARRLHLLRNIDWRLGSLLAPLRVEDRVDTIVANLPYLPDDQLGERSLKFEPVRALSGGPDGARVMAEMIAQLADWPGITTVFLELLPSHIDTISHDLRQQKFSVVAISDGHAVRGLLGRR